jgi:hypothetical protein
MEMCVDRSEGEGECECEGKGKDEGMVHYKLETMREWVELQLLSNY